MISEVQHTGQSIQGSSYEVWLVFWQTRVFEPCLLKNPMCGFLNEMRSMMAHQSYENEALWLSSVPLAFHSASGELNLTYFSGLGRSMVDSVSHIGVGRGLQNTFFFHFNPHNIWNMRPRKVSGNKMDKRFISDVQMRASERWKSSFCLILVTI